LEGSDIPELEYGKRERVCDEAIMGGEDGGKRKRRREEKRSRRCVSYLIRKER
jgi:hypothetical protein